MRPFHLLIFLILAGALAVGCQSEVASSSEANRRARATPVVDQDSLVSFGSGDPQARAVDQLQGMEPAHRMRRVELDSLWAALIMPPISVSTHRIDSLDVTGDGAADVLLTLGCGTALCIYDTFVSDGDDVVYVGQIDSGLGPAVCRDETGRTVVATAWARLYGGGLGLYRVTADSIETVAKAELGPGDSTGRHDFPQDFFPAGCGI